MIYRTITVNSVLSSSSLSVEAVIDNVTASAFLSEREVYADGELTNNIVSVTAQIPESIQTDARLVTKVQSGEYEPYSGLYEFTPTQATQTVQTAHRVLLENITINPIPNNYGLISWNGAVLTVS